MRPTYETELFFEVERHIDELAKGIDRSRAYNKEQRLVGWLDGEARRIITVHQRGSQLKRKDVVVVGNSLYMCGIAGLEGNSCANCRVEPLSRALPRSAGPRHVRDVCPS